MWNPRWEFWNIILRPSCGSLRMVSFGILEGCHFHGHSGGICAASQVPGTALGGQEQERSPTCRDADGHPQVEEAIRHVMSCCYLVILLEEQMKPIML